MRKIRFILKEIQYFWTKLLFVNKHKRILEMHGFEEFLTIWNGRAYWMRNEQNLHLLAKNAIDHKYQQLSWTEWKQQFVLLKLQMGVKSVNKKPPTENFIINSNLFESVFLYVLSNIIEINSSNCILISHLKYIQNNFLVTFSLLCIFCNSFILRTWS